METNNSFNALLDIQPTQWRNHGVQLLAYSSGGNMLVNSFIAKCKGAKWYGFRTHERDASGNFTGKQWFDVSRA